MADDTESYEDVLKGIIGQPTAKAKVIVERGPVMHFAESLLSTSPVYRNPEAAKEAGFDGIPAPLTWPFAMEFAGKFEEIQPADAPTGNPLMAAMGPLMATPTRPGWSSTGAGTSSGSTTSTPGLGPKDGRARLSPSPTVR